MSEFAVGGFVSRSYEGNGQVAPRSRVKPEVIAPTRLAKEFEGEEETRGGGENPRSDARTKAPSVPPPAAATRLKRTRLEKTIGLLLAALGAAILAAAAFLVLPSTIKVSRYEISGAESLSREEILGAALLRGNEYFFSLDVPRIESALLAEPRIAYARVTPRFPGILKIDVIERKPVALVLVEEEGKLASVCLDAQGMAFAYARDYFGATKAGSSGTKVARIDLPVISGLKFSGFCVGTRLNADCLPSIAAIGDIESRSPALLQAFSEIKIVKSSYGETELILYPLRSHVPVRTGAVLNEATLRSIILVLDVLSSRGLAEGLEEIDFRTGTVVYRAKEGQPG